MKLGVIIKWLSIAVPAVHVSWGTRKSGLHSLFLASSEFLWCPLQVRTSRYVRTSPILPPNSIFLQGNVVPFPSPYRVTEEIAPRPVYDDRMLQAGLLMIKVPQIAPGIHPTHFRPISIKLNEDPFVFSFRTFNVWVIILWYAASEIPVLANRTLRLLTVPPWKVRLFAAMRFYFQILASGHLPSGFQHSKPCFWIVCPIYVLCFGLKA